MKKIKIVFFTGKRGGFSHYVPILKLIKKNKQFEFKIVVTDMHVSKKFGETINEVKEYSNKIHSIKTIDIKDNKFDRGNMISFIIPKMQKFLFNYKPNFLIVLGDRAEVLGATIASLHLGIPIVHMYGGDVTQGGTDEPTRHAITKLSHIHFTSNKFSMQNVLNLREEKWRVFNVGFSSLDSFYENSFFYKKNLIFKKYNLDIDLPLVILIQHSVTWQVSKARSQIVSTLNALYNLKLQIVAIYPCSDPGHSDIIKELKIMANKNKNFHLHKNINLKDFYNLFKFSSLIIGNSSCAITESSFFQIPAINIGIRQMGRFAGENVFHVGHSKRIIRKHIIKLIDKKNNFSCSKNIYGNGKSSKKILYVLKKMVKNKKLLEKKFVN